MERKVVPCKTDTMLEEQEDYTNINTFKFKLYEYFWGGGNTHVSSCIDSEKFTYTLILRV
jgi:hypothetical protein